MAFTRNKGEMTGDEAFARLSTYGAQECSPKRAKREY